VSDARDRVSDGAPAPSAAVAAEVPAAQLTARRGSAVAANTLTRDEVLTPDFCVVGSGAGGSVAAATLAAAGASVVILEEGSQYGRRDFNMQEAWAYPALYQDHGNRATEDLAITILQGRTVGGGTTVNWTGSFRTPTAILDLWAKWHAVAIDEAALLPHFEAVETRLAIPKEGTFDDVNRNNRMLWEGAQKLGWGPKLIRRNVKGCARLGYCGLGCPIDAKQSALITYVPDAIAAGATLYSNCRVTKLERTGQRIDAVMATVLDPAPDRPNGRHVTVKPKRGVVLAGGAINTPALLLASGIGSESGLVGKRTFLHPTVPMVGIFPERIEGFYGAPLSVSCHHFAERGDKVGYFLEVAPIHPMLAAIAFPGFGNNHRRFAERLPFAQATIGLLIDGHKADPGGTVTVTEGGRIKLAYPLGNELAEAGKDAMANMARLLLAAGASEVISLHNDPVVVKSEKDLPALVRAPFGPNLLTVFSAHQMGGAAMGDDPKRAVVNSRGRHHQIENLWVVDGSVFPTALGVNPQLSVFGHARLFASELARAG
jgi:choline dehydrogenase-like flavoprotein